MKRKTIKIPIYFGDLILYQVADLEELRSKHELTKVSSYGAIMWDEVTDSGYLKYHIAFLEDVDHDIIAHESLHLVSRIFRHRGMTMDVYNDESQCYLLGWIITQCYKFLDK